MSKRYVIDLTDEEIEFLHAVVKKGRESSHRIKHAYILLNSDQNGPNMSDQEIATLGIECTVHTSPFVIPIPIYKSECHHQSCMERFFQFS